MSEIVPPDETPEMGDVFTITPKPEFVYVIEFSTGTLKVGFSNDPNQRIATHRLESRRFGADVLRTWVSVAHGGGKANEQALIAWCSSNGTNEAGNEYFRNVAFDDVVAYAKNLPYPPVPPPRTHRLPPRSMFIGGLPRKAYVDGMELAIGLSMRLWELLFVEIGERALTPEQIRGLVDGVHNTLVESTYTPAAWASNNPEKAS